MRNKILVSLLFVLLLPSVPVLAQTDCPHGLVNEPYPGSCGLYTDQTNDQICDLSQEIATTAISDNTTATDIKDLIIGKELKTKTVQEGATIFGIDAEIFARTLSQTLGQHVSVNDSFQLLHDNYGLSPDSAKDIAINIKTGETRIDTTTATENTTEYYMWQVTLIAILLYGMSLLLVKTNKLNFIYHKRFWNFFLLLSFVITVITSIIILLRLNYSILIPFPVNVVFWHIEIGYVMILIGLFHTFWHLPYYKNLLKK